LLLLCVGVGFRVSRRDPHFFFQFWTTFCLDIKRTTPETRLGHQRERRGGAFFLRVREREREAFAKRSPFCGATLSLSLSGFCARVSRVCFLIAFHFLFPADCKEFEREREREREREKEREKERDERGRW